MYCWHGMFVFLHTPAIEQTDTNKPILKKRIINVIFTVQ